jgi:putative ABC transport system substrate-binding protein
MRRREFIKLLGGAATGWPLAVRAKERTARIGALFSFTETNPESKGLVTAVEKQLNAAGWHKGRNLEIDYRWAASDPERFARAAEELVRAAPDVLLAFATPALIPLKKSATSIPIVFSAVSDPIGQGFVTNLAHPGGNMTGFSNYDPDIGGKWLQLLKEVAPLATNVTVMFNPQTSPYNVLWMRSTGIRRMTTAQSPQIEHRRSNILAHRRRECVGGLQGVLPRMEAGWPGNLSTLPVSLTLAPSIL